MIVIFCTFTEEALHTADFVEKFDQLFNSLNSKTVSSPALMRHALSPTSGHLDFWKEKLVWIKSVKSKGIFHYIYIYKLCKLYKLHVYKL